ncbi:MAG: metallophosphoesterase, partial [Candidatus Magasanikbacteria bacterium]|nr:metallophosphoesterase [Candidatus Magasanikbacteria bacterium]
MKFLIFGDVVGKMGRAVVKHFLPLWREETSADLILINAENLAHGAGATPKTIQEMMAVGVDVFTGGNHIFNKPDVQKVFTEDVVPLLRPANYAAGTAGRGYVIVEAAGRRVLIVNLVGQVFMKEEVGNPFTALDDILKMPDNAKVDAVVVDFHADASSERVALGWFAAERGVSCFYGTHTHIPSADARILPDSGCAYVTDIGMTGARDACIGVDKDVVIRRFLTQSPEKFQWPETGVAVARAISVTIDDDGKG